MSAEGATWGPLVPANLSGKRTEEIIRRRTRSPVGESVPAPSFPQVAEYSIRNLFLFCQKQLEERIQHGSAIGSRTFTRGQRLK